MKQSISTDLVGKQDQYILSTYSRPHRAWLPLLMLLLLNGLLPVLLGWSGHLTGSAYAQCSTSAPTVVAKWDFNSTTQACNGAVTKKGQYWNPTAPIFLSGTNSYCPQINAGCGQAILSTRGFGNTYDFKNALCLAGFWRNDGGIYSKAPGWNVNDVVFHPEIAGNLFVDYTLPAGKAGSLTSFSLRFLQKQFNGTSPSFEKQGVGVYRNGVLIYSDTKTITAADVNGSAMVFTFPNTSEFVSDGSAEVKFEVVFGLVHRLLKISSGYDDICLNGTCGTDGSPTPTAAITPATCGAGSANANGKITLTNFGVTDKYDISIGSSYTGSQTYATATGIPAGGVITSTLPNPASPQVYTVRVFTSAGCTTDLQVTLNPTVCANPGCTAPIATVAGTPASCSGTSVNNDASLAISGVSGGDRVGLSPGSTYTGPAYSAAQPLSAGAYTFTALPNPNGSQDYTIRVFSAGDCFTDYPVTLTETVCGAKRLGIQVVASDQADPNSTPNNNKTTEDDFTSYEVVAGTQFIDLKLSKTVNPTTGATCPTNTDFVWTLVLTNEGTMDATNIQVTDNMDADLFIVSATPTSGTFTISGGWLLPSLSAGASTTLTITTKASKPGTYTNCAWVSDAFPLNDPDSSPLNDNTANEDDDDCASITVTGPQTPTIVKLFSHESAKTGAPISLIIKITNNEATPIILTAPFTDNLPASPAQMVIAPTPNLITGLTGVSATAGGTTVTIPAGTALLPGLNQIQVDVVVPADGEYCNKILAGALQTTSCANVAETEACVEFNSTYVMAPQIRKSFSPEIVQTGQNSTLTITINNPNATAITLLQDFKDSLPAGLVLAGAPTGNCTGISSFSTTDNVGLVAGSVVAPGICTITVPVTSTTAANYCNRIIMNSLIGTVSNGTIPVMTGNEDIAEACLTVTDSPCTPLAITSVLPTPLTVAPGATLSLTAIGTGFGPSTLYTWTGTGNFNTQTVSTTYTAPATTGTYTLTVAADNRLTGYGTCADVLSLSVVVQEPCNLTATAQASSNTVCAGQPVTLTAQATPVGSYTYAWSAPAGVTLTGASTATATATNLPTGLTTFTVTVNSSPACSSTATVSVLVNPVPVLSVQTICAPDAQTYSIVGTVSPASATVTDQGRIVVRNADSFTIAGILTAVGDVVRAETVEGCVTSLTVAPPSCQPLCVLPVGLSVTTACTSALDGSGQLVATATSLSGTVEYRLNGIGAFGPSGTFTNLTNGTYTVEARLVGSTAPNCLVSTTAVISCVCIPPAVNAQSSSTSILAGQSVTLTAQATPADSYTYAWSGPGTITPTNASAVTASGLPAGVNTFTVTVTSSPGCLTTATVSVAVLEPALAVVVNTPVCNTLTNTYTATGTVSLTNVQTGSLTITDNGTSIATIAVTTGQMSATFSATGVSGSSPASHTVVAGLGTATASTTYATPASCTVCSLSITTASLPDGQVGTAYSQTITTTGGTAPVSYSLTGSLPAGLTLDPATGVLSGTSTASGTASFSVTVTDGKACTALVPLSITTSAAPVCSLTATATPGVCNTATNTYALTGSVSATNTTGNQSLTVSVGSVSTILTLTGNGPVSYTLTGLESDGLTNTVSVISSATACGTASVTFTAPASCSVAPPVLAVVVGNPICNTLTNQYTATGTVSLSNVASGSQLEITDNGTSVTVVTVALGQTSVAFTVTGVSNAGSHTVVASLGTTTASTTYATPESCTVCSLSLTTASLPEGQVGTVYAQTLTTGGGTAPVTFSLTGGSLPSGLTLDGATGVISGTPTSATTSSLSITAIDSKLCPSVVALTIITNEAPVCSLSATATPTDCNTATNQYALEVSVAAVNSSASQTLTLTVGSSSTIVTLTDNGPESYTLTGLVSDGLMKTLTVLSSATACGTASVTFTAPTSCTVCNLPTNLTTNISCLSATNGSGQIVATATGSNVEYRINNGAFGPSGVFSNLTNGTYTIEARIAGTTSPACSITTTAEVNCNCTPPTLTVESPSTTVCAPATFDLTSSSIITTNTGARTLFYTNLADANAGGSAGQLTNPQAVTASGTYYIRSETNDMTCFVVQPFSVTLVNCQGNLGDFVWKDANNNGLQDADEPGVANVIVDLYTVTAGVRSSLPIATTTTSSSGVYGFTGLASGDYQLKFTLPASLTGTCEISAKPNTGGNDAIDSDVDPVTGFAPVVTIDATQPESSTARNNPTLDMGLRIRTSPAILDPCQCFGVEYDISEKRELFETVEVTSSTGESWSVVAQTGMLALDTLVKRPVLTGTLLTETSVGSGKYDLSFTHENAVGYSVTVTNGESVLEIANVCSKYPDYTTTVLSETMCRTAAPVALTALAGVPSTAVFYYIDKTTSQRVVITEFDPSQFNEGDTIRVKLEIKPTDPATCSFTIVQNVVINSDACNQPLGSIGDFVWKDNNNNGLQDPNEPPVSGIQVELFTVNGGVTSTSALQTTLTNSSGLYLFEELPSGDYRVKFTVPASLTGACELTDKQNAGDDTRDSDVDPATGLSPVVTINTSGTGIVRDNPTIDAGLQRRIYDPVGYIYCYKDGTILKGGTISVTGPGSITITQDGSQGYYQFFTDGTPGSYTLSYNSPNSYSIATGVRPPAGSLLDPTGLEGTPTDRDGELNGWIQFGSDVNADTTALLDASAAQNPYYLVFNLQPGDPYISENNLPIDCTPLLGSIGDLVWKDINRNGQFDPGSETGVASVTVNLLEVTSPVGASVISTSLVSTTVTGSNGTYLFSNLPAGRYIVEFDKTTLPVSCSLSPDYQKAGVPTDLNSDADPVTGRSPIVTIAPTDPAQRDILTIDAALVTPDCPLPPKCVPLVIQKIRGPRR